MRFTYRLSREKGGYLAACVESDALGEGPTEKDAVESLRQSLEERMFRPDAVAPPTDPADAHIELVRSVEAKEAPPSIDLGGPGDAPLR